MGPFKEKGELPFPQLRRNDPGMVGGKSSPPKWKSRVWDPRRVCLLLTKDPVAIRGRES